MTDDARDEYVMTRKELRTASSRLGCLIAAERGLKMGKIGSAYGVGHQKMRSLLEEWRAASATVWPLERGPKAA